MAPVRKPNMAEHHLKDIVELSEKPSLNSHNPEYDKFGFEIDEDRCTDEIAEGERRLSQEMEWKLLFRLRKLSLNGMAL